MNLRQAAQQALEALEGLADYRYTDRVKNTMASLRQALAEPEQEPVAWMTHSNDLLPLFHATRVGALNWATQPTPLYTAPTPRKPLTDYINAARINASDSPHMVVEKLQSAIERAHGIGEQHD